ncbi:MAG: phosphonate ABC transporter, permease protein PhnE, partial [Corynebacterium sp.]|nr:phosphonate ABC transporter, permease protein PhnE [Corynebacterium sp.]
MSTALNTSLATGTEIPARPRSSFSGVAAGLVLFLLCAAGIWSIDSLGINIPTLVNSFDNAVNFIGRMFPLDFPPLGESVALIVETLAIVFLATLLSVVLSIPVALMAARTTTRGRFSQGTARALIVLARAIPDLVLAIVF